MYVVYIDQTCPRLEDESILDKCIGRAYNYDEPRTQEFDDNQETHYIQHMSFYFEEWDDADEFFATLKTDARCYATKAMY